eukprot:174299-Chlamydomonas_euryale.AAC.1
MEWQAHDSMDLSKAKVRRKERGRAGGSGSVSVCGRHVCWRHEREQVCWLVAGFPPVFADCRWLSSPAVLDGFCLKPQHGWC